MSAHAARAGPSREELARHVRSFRPRMPRPPQEVLDAEDDGSFPFVRAEDFERFEKEHKELHDWIAPPSDDESDYAPEPEERAMDYRRVKVGVGSCEVLVPRRASSEK